MCAAQCDGPLFPGLEVEAVRRRRHFTVHAERRDKMFVSQLSAQRAELDCRAASCSQYVPHSHRAAFISHFRIKFVKIHLYITQYRLCSVNHAQ